MKNLSIVETKYTPQIEFNASTRILNITGKSYPENTFEFYAPVNAWLKDFFDTLNDEKVFFNLDLEYLNSSSLKAYFDMFDMLEEASVNGVDVEVQWIYDKENDIAQETGEDFIEDFKNLNIELVVKP